MKVKELTRKQMFFVASPTCGVATGKQCVLIAGGLRNEPHTDRKLLAAEAMKKKLIKTRSQEASV